MYPEKLFQGQPELLRAQDVPATMFGLSVYNATDKCALLYRGAQYVEPHYDVKAHHGWGFVAFRFGSLKFVDCPRE